MKLRSSKLAFTLIELLVAIAIIVILTAFLVPQVGVLRRKSLINNTRAFIKKIDTALKLYYDQFLDYPPDGFDNNADGDPGYNYASGGVELGTSAAWRTNGSRYFKNTGCLVYFLCMPMIKVTRVGATVAGDTSTRNLRRSKVGPFLTEMTTQNFSIGDFKVDDLNTEAINSRIEFVDAWGRPLEYDKVTRAGNFNNALFNGNLFGDGGTNPHWADTQNIVGVEDDVISDCEITENIEATFDPRRPTTAAGCVDTGQAARAENNGHYDIWSHGPLWSDPTDDICSWSIN